MNKNKITEDEKSEKKTEEKVENSATEIAEKAIKEAPKSASEQLIEAILKNPKVAIFIGHILEGKNPGITAVEDFGIKPALTHVSMDKIISAINISQNETENNITTANHISELLADPDSNSNEIISLIAKGLNYENEIEKSYIKGRNEKIETEERSTLNPSTQGKTPNHENNGFLKNPRKSIWDY